MPLHDLLAGTPSFARFARHHPAPGRPTPLHCADLFSACGWLAATAATRPVLLLCGEANTAADAAACLQAWGNAPLAVLHGSAPFTIPTDAAAQGAALARWRAVPAGILVADAAALAASYPDAAGSEQPLHLRRGDTIRRDELRARLGALGYGTVGSVLAAGDCAVRGGLVDVWPAGDALPCRLDFAGDRLEDLRLFDPVSQMAVRRTDAVSIAPRRAFALTEERREKLAALLRPFRTPVFAPLKEALAAGREMPLFDLLGRAAGFTIDAGDALARDGMLCAAWQPAALARALAAQAQALADARRGLPFPAEFVALLAAHHGDAAAAYARLHAGPALDIEPAPRAAHGGFTIPARALPELLATDAAGLPDSALAAAGKRRHAAFFVPPDREPRALAAALTERGLAARAALPADTPGPGAAVLPAALPSPLALLFTEADLLCYRPVRPPQRTVSRRAWRHADDASPITALFDLQPGDFVVHLQYGIGRFERLQAMPEQGGDFLRIAYAGGDMLYVPVDKLHLIHKYVGSELHPALSPLRGGSWGSVARRLHASVRDLAQQLLAVHAARLAQAGHAYAVDTPEAAAFAAGFPHTPTFDQERAFAAVARDLAAPRPMDRLVCGDVGFGKTEVALRAAFAVMAGGRQVAFLCPTTLLAQQHYQTCRDRLRGFPFTVGLLSRFRSPRQQRQTVAAAKRGDIDLLIGTHRLLSADVGFLDLGLVIIDEEQRFGVRHKERLKALRELVDVLTLTATPIPRTLNLALSGLRDISVIETPPPRKQAVATKVLPYDEAEERRAIEAELARGGQVFYVRNRIDGLDRCAAEVRQRYPQARVAIAHGQLPDDELEDTMAAFLVGDYDILVTTAIIESGLDMPRVNTLVVRDAHLFGLADLYQLRGRVGRAAVAATALFFYPPTLPLGTAVRDRLEAIETFTELGAGFQLALRDMEIRGAGNVLGEEQHGLLEAVGIPLYTQLLEDELARHSGLRTRAEAGPTIRLPVSGALPETYIPDERTRLKLYKRLAQCAEPDALAALRDELRERFGTPPPEAALLLDLVAVRQQAERLALAELSLQDGTLTLRFGTPAAFPPALLRAQRWSEGPRNPYSLQRAWRSDIAATLPLLAADLAALADALPA